MKPYYKEKNITIHQGKCEEVLKIYPTECFDSLVTDPPSGINFMGKSWDSDKGGRDMWIEWLTGIMKECYRVLKPGAHGLVWALPRTSHWTVTAIENAGFEIRDIIMHVFGTGFPKSLAIGKAIDKINGTEKIIGKGKAGKTALGQSSNWNKTCDPHEFNITEPNSPEAKQWDGWGTALKPAEEHWILCRKPISEKNIALNVLKYGTGGINIDGCRVGTTDDLNGGSYGSTTRDVDTFLKGKKPAGAGVFVQPKGRFPANVIHDGSDEVVGLFPNKKTTWVSPTHANNRNGEFLGKLKHPGQQGFNDSGSAARFFYCAKPSKAERNLGLSNVEAKKKDESRKEGNPGGDNPRNRGVKKESNNHPTVKSIKLMQYLCRLITPTYGRILDPFMGSGSTGCAAIKEGFSFDGIESENEYCNISKHRIQYVINKNKNDNTNNIDNFFT